MNSTAGAGMNSTDDSEALGTPAGAVGTCKYANGSTFAAATFFIIFFLFMSSKIVNMVFDRIGQPRLLTELTVGLVVGNLGFMHQLLELVIPQLFTSYAEMGMSCYLLVLGIEMDLSVLTQKPSREAIIAYTGILSTFVVTSMITPLIKLGLHDSVGFIVSLSIILTGTSSPVLTRLVTDLKISKSDIGRLLIGAGIHTDMITMLVVSITLVFHPFRATTSHDSIKLKHSIFQVIGLILIIILFAKILPMFIRWINERNPEGRPMIGSDLVLFVAIMMVLCSSGPILIGYSPTMASFLIGLTFPRKGRISRMLVGKINQIMNYIIFPLYFCYVGALADFGALEHEADAKFLGIKLFFLYVIVTIGKVAGALMSGLLFGFHWHVAVTIGLFLNVKGHFHIFVAAFALREHLVSTGTYIVMVFLAILTIALTPLIVKLMIEPERIALHRRMALQWVNPSAELRILVGIHGLENVPTMINLMEMTRGDYNRPGIAVYLTDMIEINDCNSMVLGSQDHQLPDHNHQLDSVADPAVADESVVNLRAAVSSAILSYVEESGNGINVHRLLAISSFANMHHDIYKLAEAVTASLIVLPFHRNQKKDGKMDGVHHGFRHVNRKVLRLAPCSVGILVDRGLGLIKNLSNSSNVSIQAAVVFIGGKDDREALAYASRIAQHPALKLTAVRFLEDTNSDNKQSTKTKKTRMVRNLEEQETKLDDECFTDFYEKKVARGGVGYVEKHVVDAKDTVTALKALESQYTLFIVGRAGRVNSILTAGMSDWEECPDLGPIGEIMADSDFSTTASVLVIQQHSLDELENEFNIM